MTDRRQPAEGSTREIAEGATSDQPAEGVTSRALIESLCESAIGLNQGWSRVNAEWLRDLALARAGQPAEGVPLTREQIEMLRTTVLNKLGRYAVEPSLLNAVFDLALRGLQGPSEQEVIEELSAYSNEARCEVCSGAGCVGVPGAQCSFCDGSGKNRLALAFKWVALEKIVKVANEYRELWMICHENNPREPQTGELTRLGQLRGALFAAILRWEGK